MKGIFLLHVNNHANTKSERTKRAEISKFISKFTDGYKVKLIPKFNKSSYTFAGIVCHDKMNIGIATCHPNDQFCKKVGRDKAIGRAKSSINIVGKSFQVDIPKDLIESNKLGEYFNKICYKSLEQPYVEVIQG